MRALSLFSGIAGIDLAGEWAGFETAAFCEWDEFPRMVLRRHWPNATIYGDVRELTKERLEEDGIIGPGRTIDIIHGGYPCQPFSHAGKREGTEDDRHLWPEVFRLIQALQPRWFVGENVAGHITLGLDIVLSDLESAGYAWETFVLPAAAVGSPQRRDRVFIVAYSKSLDAGGLPFGKEPAITRLSISSENVANSKGKRRNEAREYCKRPEEWSSSSGEVLVDTSCPGQQELNIATITEGTGLNTGCNVKTGAGRSAKSRVGRNSDGIPQRMDGDHWPAAWGEEQKSWEPPRVSKGIKNRDGRLKALGNAVNPYQIYPILVAIKQIDDAMMNIR